MKLCKICQKHEVSGRRRKYCGPECAREAKNQWKRDLRKKSKELGTKLENTWRTPDERRAYYKTYMRRYRKRTRKKRLTRLVQ
jgi:hypothetical protein